MKIIFYSFFSASKKSLLLFFASMVMVCAQAISSPVIDPPGKTPIKKKLSAHHSIKAAASKVKTATKQQTAKVLSPAVLACPCHLFTPAEVPDIATETNLNDAVALEMGLRFKTDIDGFIHGIRFFKSSLDVGATHTATLWDNTGTTILAQADFVGETASGWQELIFSVPVAVTAGTVYVASYYSPN